MTIMTIIIIIIIIITISCIFQPNCIIKSLKVLHFVLTIIVIVFHSPSRIRYHISGIIDGAE